MTISKVLLVCVFIIAACNKKKTDISEASQPVVVAQAPEPQAFSFSGKPLFSSIADTIALAKSDSIIAVLKAKPSMGEDDYVEIGRQFSATFRYKEAVDNFSIGLQKFNNSYKLLRFRGHRYLTLRKPDLAVADLLRARDLIKSEPDIWEFDTTGKKTDTYQHQIEYHLGVYYFVMHSYKEAVEAFDKSLKDAHDSKEIAGSTDWLYNAYQRNGQKNEAEKLLKTISPQFKTDPELAYFRRILLYKGVIKPSELVDESMPFEKMTVQEVTKLYGLANWYGFHGDSKHAMDLYVKILQTNSWPAFAYLASEKEVVDK